MERRTALGVLESAPIALSSATVIRSHVASAAGHSKENSRRLMTGSLTKARSVRSETQMS